MARIDEQISGVWRVEQEILDVLHTVCTENNIRYSLAYGTLIGAVRHKGFIPWDDDIDIIMPREDYEKLLSIWNDSAPKEYIIQNSRTDSDYTNTFSKIRKNHTTFLQDDGESKKQYHKGIFVDIFPGDRVAPGRISRLGQYIASAVNLLYTRNYTSGSKGVVGAIERVLLRFPAKSRLALRNFSECVIRKWNGKRDSEWVFPSTIVCAKRYHKADLFENMGEISFNGKRYMCISDPDAFLRVEYGDYMQLPPEEERTWKHHPIIIDFEHNYEELNLRNER